MAIEITDKKRCTGCSACANICPKNAIEMIADESGFLYPVVNHDLCVECGMCTKTCPLLDERFEFSSPLLLFAAWNKNQSVRIKSTSGGIFSELAYRIVNEGGCVVGAVYNEDNQIEHCIVYDEAGIERVRQSKYAQSEIGTVYSQIKEELKEKKVLFCGTPCQVAGLKKFLKSKSDNLITVDFICRGVNSPKALQAWIKEIELEHRSTVQSIWFKYKEDGWHKSPKCTKVTFANGLEAVYKGKDNSFMCGYLGPNLYIRPCCGNCAFKGEKRVSDITLGDFWGIDEKLDDDQGTSLVMINSEQGQVLFEGVKDKLFWESKNVEDIVAGNVCFNQSVSINKRSESFLRELDSKGFSETVKKYSKKSLTNYLLSGYRRMKKFFGRIVNKKEG